MEKSCIFYFFLNSAATHHFSSRPAPRGAAADIKTEGASEIILSWGGEGGGGPKSFYPYSSIFMQIISKDHPSVVGEMLTSPCLLKSPV